MKTTLKAAAAACALLALGVTGSVALAAPAAPHFTLVSTDTVDPYPFAAIVYNHTTYHVTEGDVLDGVHVRKIEPGKVILSNDRVLIAVGASHPDEGARGANPITSYQVGFANKR